MIVSQLRNQSAEIPQKKTLDLLSIKRRLDLPDARFPEQNGEPQPGRLPISGPTHRPSVLKGTSQTLDMNANEFAGGVTTQILEVLEVCS